MKYLLIISMLAVFAFPAFAQTHSVPPAPNPPVTREALQAEQTRGGALIQRQRDQIDSLTRQMQALKTQIDTLSRELGETAVVTDQAEGRFSQATGQRYGLQVRH